MPTPKPPHPAQQDSSLERAIQELKLESPESAQLVELHVYLGLSLQETAKRMQLSEARAEALWLHARHWLQRRLGAASGI